MHHSALSRQLLGEARVTTAFMELGSGRAVMSTTLARIPGEAFYGDIFWPAPAVPHSVLTGLGPSMLKQSL